MNQRVILLISAILLLVGIAVLRPSITGGTSLKWQLSTDEFTLTTLQQGLNLSNAFGTTATFYVREAEGVQAEIIGDTLYVRSTTPGDKTIVVYATEGTTIIKRAITITGTPQVPTTTTPQEPPREEKAE